ncbi:MAG: hypothetical protein EPO01_07370 [Aquabacterium sp.]|nr:MAG: hypothetical protein EPO01_07370 [Aquabacterium sp.]
MVDKNGAHSPAVHFDETTVAVAHEQLARPGPVPSPGGDGTLGQAYFDSLRKAYQPSGGLADVDVLALTLEAARRTGSESLSRLVVLGKVFSFAWGTTFWVPMFQFESADLSVRQASSEVLSELIPALDGLSIAAWFLQPQAALQGRSPLGTLDADPAAVLRAAHARRLAVHR